MKISYDKLFDKLKSEGVTQKEIKEKLKFSNGIFDNLRHNKPVTTETIGKLCEFFMVQPSDIMQIIYENDVDNIEKTKVQKQIEELQNKLKNM